jgi:hypothetical protein
LRISQCLSTIFFCQAQTSQDRLHQDYINNKAMMDRIHAQEHAEVCGHAGGGRGVLVTDVCMCFMCVLARVLVVARKHADDDDTHTCTHTHTV